MSSSPDLREIAMTSSTKHRSYLATLLALAALATFAAQPAAADDPSARFYASDSSTQTTRWCETPWALGAKGAYGAWGYYIDGCTAIVKCPWGRCRTMQATGLLTSYSGETATCNATARVFTSAGTLRWRTDRSDLSYSGNCWASLGAPDTSYGEYVTVQTNGVVAQGWAKVKSYIWLVPA
jgi:hypothetical protein